MRRILLLMCMMLIFITTASAQSHTVTRKPKNNSSTVTKPPATRTPSSGKKTTNSSSGKKTGTNTSSGKQTISGASGKKTTPSAVQTDEKPSTKIAGTGSITNCPDSNHPHAIDLGLPSGTKWACCNVGAAKPEDYGGYFAWGETSEKTNYDWSTYIHCNGSLSTCRNLGNDIAGTQYDVAHVKWGGAWVMPSFDQIKELLNNCTYTWTSINGVKGGKFTGKNGGVIFLPAAGRRWDGGLYSAGSYGYYWSSTQRPSYSYYAYDLYFYSGYAYWYHYYYRHYGYAVRPVSR